MLNRNDIYYTQLPVTGLEWCDFVVCCQNDYYLETISFDAEEWQTIKDKADICFSSIIICKTVFTETWELVL